VQKQFLILLGARPEAIKLFPVINRLKAERGIAITVCATAQHQQLLDQVLKPAKECRISI
jgi:UDP-N-acetylglucosamine 2-epimerase (non-hydrolysing)